jgi:hypothetical protein
MKTLPVSDGDCEDGSPDVILPIDGYQVTAPAGADI